MPRCVRISNPAGNKDLGFIGPASGAADINDLGQAVGASLLGNGESRAILFDASNPGMFTIFDSLNGATISTATAINNKGEVIGLSAGSFNTPWIYDPETGLVFALSGLISPGDPLYGQVTITQADDINDRGQIVGQAYFSNLGEFHAVLLTPVPLPAALPLFLAALSALGLACRRRHGTDSWDFA